MRHNASLGPLGAGGRRPSGGVVEHVAGVEVEYNQRWMELGGAGIFRPEVTLPVGVKPRVAAQGAGTVLTEDPPRSARLQGKTSKDL